jgi:hypothetical protein
MTGLLAALGFGAGAAVGFVCATLFGAGGPRRIGRMVRRSRPVAAPVLRARRLADIGNALARDADLAAVSIEVHPAGTAFELRGRVPSRAARARAYRAAIAAAPGARIQNRLLVTGEDDSPVSLVVDDAPRSA